jgi:sugar phosphate isomerase/epimerase
MPRPVILFTGQWADMPLEELAQKASEWGYQGVDLCCWGDHFEVQRALSEPDYCQNKIDLLARHDLTVSVVSSHRIGQAVCDDPIDVRHKKMLPEYVWGDGDPDGVRQRAAEEMASVIRASQKLGVGVVAGFTGSPLWASVLGYPPPDRDMIERGLKTFASQWLPILDVCRDANIRFAFEVHPGQIAFDLYSAEMALEAVEGREEFGFNFDPSHFHWQGIDPTEFIRRFPNRIFHVHIKDVKLNLNGKNGILGSYLPLGDPRRGWDFRCPGHGGIDWEGIIRALNDIDYEGPLSVEFRDAGMDREYGAEEACKFTKRLNFSPPAPARDGPFRRA